MTMTDEMPDIILRTGVKIVEADHFMAVFEQPVA
jgi:hypothetical protein